MYLPAHCPPKGEPDSLHSLCSPRCPSTPQSSSLNQHRNQLLLFLQDKWTKSGHQGVRWALGRERGSVDAAGPRFWLELLPGELLTGLSQAPTGSMRDQEWGKSRGTTDIGPLWEHRGDVACPRDNTATTQQHCCWTEGHYRDYSQTYLPTPGLYHELSGQMRGWLGLQGSDDNALVQGVTRHNLKHRDRMQERCWGLVQPPGEPEPQQETPWALRTPPALV